MHLKTAIRLAFDLLILVAMVLLYNTRAMGLAYHEIAGLVLFAFFIVHLASNRLWITAITSRLASGTLPARTVFSYGVSLGLLAAFLAVGVSGVAISRVVFDFHSSWPVWKTIHKTGAAIALILTGIHLGLHHAFILGMLAKWFSIPDTRSILHELRIARPFLGISLSAKSRSVLLKTFVALVLAGGAASFATTPFFRWLSLPFVTKPAKQASALPAPAAAARSRPRRLLATPSGPKRSRRAKNHRPRPRPPPALPGKPQQKPLPPRQATASPRKTPPEKPPDRKPGQDSATHPASSPP
ncbi:DUF4405 domain-containing protein [Oxalobacter paraformigenes]|uniref:Flavinylation-associated cytochrome domain-containing protein n=1 Tax=Oxalobacter paraformigenes TaxID=556268 RepID=T5LQN5_9BURK|nr:DUF4405 domain-containing protein [Oxalobacter paraformigenes]EQM95250.1 hypothetical protein OFAG_02195 [Oxalobacter paraformigenes]